MDYTYVPTILDVIPEFFKIHRALDPTKLDVFMGQYKAYSPDQRTRKASRTKSIDFGKGVSLPFGYFVEYDLESIPFLSSGSKVEWQPSGKMAKFHLQEGHRLADIVVDSEQEMRACKFRWAKNIAELSDETRQEFKRPLAEITFMPDTGTTSSPEQIGGEFIRDLAELCTYDEDGKYYPKWKWKKTEKHPKPPAVLDVTTADPNYFKRIFREQVLMRDRIYVAVFSVAQYELYLLDVKDGVLKEKVVYHLVDSYTAQQHEADLKSAEKIAFFFYTMHGTASYNPPEFKTADAHQKAAQRLADPAAMVRSRKAKKELSHVKDDFDWFVEMVELFFHDRFYFIDMAEVKKSFGMFVGPDLFQKQVAAAIYDALFEYTGNDPVTVATRVKVKKLANDPNWLVIPRGYQTLMHSRFVGINYQESPHMSGPWCYFRDIVDGHCWKLPLLNVVKNLLVESVAKDVWEATRGMIPIIEAVVWGGTAVMAFEIVGPRFIYDHVKKKLGKEALRQLIRKEILPAVVAAVTELVTDIFGWSSMAAFAKGFFDGYVVHAIYQHFVEHLETYATEGPLEYRLAKALWHLHKIIDSLMQKIELLREELSIDTERRQLQEGLEHFEKFGVHILQGAMLLGSALYWLEHKDAAPFTEAMIETASGKGPDLKQWNSEAANGLAGFIQGITAAIVDPDKLSRAAEKAEIKLEFADDLLRPLFSHPVAGAFVVGGALYTGVFLLGKSLGALIKRLPRKSWLVTVLVASLLLKSDQASDQAAGDESTAGKILDHILQFFEGALKDMFVGDAKRARFLGEMTGSLWGAVMVDGALHHGKEKVDHLFKNKKILSGVAKVSTFHADVNLHHGKIGWALGALKLLLYRYLSFYDELVTHGIFAQKRDESAFAKLLNDIDEMRLRQTLKDRNLEHLVEFKSDSETRITFEKIGLALVTVHDRLEQDQKEYLQKTYGSDIERYKKDLASFAQTLDEVGVGKWIDDREKWLKENYQMVYHHFVLHLRAAVHQLILAMGELFVGFTKNGYSWISLLQELGLQLGEVSQLTDKLHSELELFKHPDAAA
jgi:hypothetical protein